MLHSNVNSFNKAKASFHIIGDSDDGARTDKYVISPDSNRNINNNTDHDRVPANYDELLDMYKSQTQTNWAITTKTSGYRSKGIGVTNATKNGLHPQTHSNFVQNDTTAYEKEA